MPDPDPVVRLHTGIRADAVPISNIVESVAEGDLYFEWRTVMFHATVESIGTWTNARIGNIVGCNRFTVRYYLHKLGLKPYTHYQDEIVEKAIRANPEATLEMLVEDCMDLGLDVSYSTVRRVMLKIARDEFAKSQGV